MYYAGSAWTTSSSSAARGSTASTASRARAAPSSTCRTRPSAGPLRGRPPSRRALPGADGCGGARADRRSARHRDRRSRASRGAEQLVRRRERRRHGPHELVVVADGARSQLRDDTAPASGSSLTLGERSGSSGSRRAIRTDRTRIHSSGRGRQPALPRPPADRATAGCSRGAAAREPVLEHPRDRVGAWRERGLEAWKDEVAARTRGRAGRSTRSRRAEQVLFARTTTSSCIVVTRNVVYLGDAAHATSPQLGQGCNLALWDAMVLDECSRRDERDLARALDAYSRGARDHLALLSIRDALADAVLPGRRRMARHAERHHHAADGEGPHHEAGHDPQHARASSTASAARCSSWSCRGGAAKPDARGGASGSRCSRRYWLSQLTHLPVVAHLSFASLNAPT